MTRYLMPVLLLLSFTCFAQKKDRRVGAYDAYLASVETASGKFIGSVDTALSVYEDSTIKIHWKYNPTHLEFELKNKSDQTLKIIWDDAAFISINDESSRIFHKGIKYTDRENAQPPTSVYKKANLSDLIAPTSYVYYSSGKYTSGWHSRPLVSFPNSLFSSKVSYDESLLGRTMRVVLPVKIEDRTQEYTFNFKTRFIEGKR